MKEIGRLWICDVEDLDLRNIRVSGKWAIVVSGKWEIVVSGKWEIVVSGILGYLGGYQGHGIKVYRGLGYQ